MGKSLADAMNAQPGPDSLAYWLAPFKGYWDRQGQMAQGGLDQAEQGAQDFRNNLSPMGLANMLMGPANYVASPITALLPTEAETYAASDLPEWFKPGAAAGIGTMMAVMPGPKGARLGKGMEKLAEGATDAERLALQARLEAEAAQTGGAATAVTRDEALSRLTGNKYDPTSVPVRQYTPEEIAKLRARLGPKAPPKKKEIPPIEDFMPKKPRE